MSDKKKEKSPFAGLLAEQLKGLKIELTPQDSAKDQAAKKDKKGKKGAKKDAPLPSEDQRSHLSDLDDLSETPQLSDAELFEKSIREMNPEDVYRGKFIGEGPSLGPAADTDARSSDELARDADPRDEDDPERLADEQAAREGVELAREQRLFERAVGEVDPIERSDKYRRPAMPDPGEDAARRTAYRSDSPESLRTPPLPKSGEGLNNVGPLDAAQRDLYARYQKRERQHEVFEVNVRGDSVEDALRQVELFVHKNWKEDARFVRIIHGRGLQSDGDPVLKPAILHWLEGPGFRYVRGYVPEVNSAGDYGSLVVELERKS